MTVLMFQPRFTDPIRSGQKCQTIRPPRKRPIKIGDDLSLRQWEGKAYRSPQVEIAAVRCSGVFEIEVRSNGITIGEADDFVNPRPPRITASAELNAFAQGDGFESWMEMRKYITQQSGYGLPFSGVLIQWEVPPT